MKPAIKRVVYAQVVKQGNSKAVILKQSDFADLEIGAWVRVAITEVK